MNNILMIIKAQFWLKFVAEKVMLVYAINDQFCVSKIRAELVIQEGSFA
jgi:hypothetical protein